MSKHYTIRKNQEMPKNVRCFGAFCPFEDMTEVGDSFMFHAGDDKRVRLLADAYGKKHRVAFGISYTEDGGTVWRIK